METVDSTSDDTGIAGICTKRPSGRRKRRAVMGSLLDAEDTAGTTGRGRMFTPEVGGTTVLLTVDCKLVFLPLSFLADDAEDVTMADALLVALVGLAGSGLLGEWAAAVAAASWDSIGAVTTMAGVTDEGTGVHRGDGRHSDVEREGMR